MHIHTTYFAMRFPHCVLVYCCPMHNLVEKGTHTYTHVPPPFRPLPPELINYAREDTHYLLYIYDRMRNELVRRGNQNNNLLMSVLDRSRDVCLKRYEQPVFSEDDFVRLYHRNRRRFNAQQVCVCVCVCVCVLIVGKRFDPRMQLAFISKHCKTDIISKPCVH